MTNDLKEQYQNGSTGVGVSVPHFQHMCPEWGSHFSIFPPPVAIYEVVLVPPGYYAYIGWATPKTFLTKFDITFEKISLVREWAKCMGKSTR